MLLRQAHEIYVQGDTVDVSCQWTQPDGTGVRVTGVVLTVKTARGEPIGEPIPLGPECNVGGGKWTYPLVLPTVKLDYIIAEFTAKDSAGHEKRSARKVRLVYARE